MKRNLIKNISLFATLISLTACSTDANGNYAGVKQLRSPEGLPHAQATYELSYNDSLLLQEFSSKMRSFSSKLSEAIAKREYKEGSNFVVSPLSIELCLGLAVRAANGETRQELLDAMDMDYATFNSGYKLFFNSLNKTITNNMDHITAQLLLTNSIWIDDEITLKDDGLNALRDDYYCYSYEADFNYHNKDANNAIRQFNKEKTNGLIDQDLKLSPATMFVLMNTLYLKDIWNDYGENLSYASNNYKFTNSSGVVSSKSLLDGYYNLGRAITNDDYSCFYTITNSGYCIYFVKANEGKNLKDVFTKETIDYINDNSHYVKQDSEKLERYYTECIFPEFDVSSNHDLLKVFKEDFNVQKLFSGQCDLSNLSNDDVYCYDFEQIARLKVDKTGVEGAAVTYMAYAGAPGPDEYKEIYETFVVDKEFGFVLTSKDNVVFSGIVTNID